MPEGSRRLLSIWSFLYDAGLKSLVPTWRQWLPAERVEGFDHVILWRTSERVVAGRMWSSSDGAQPPRKDFPIVVCAECRGLSMNWTINEVLPYLEKMGMRFRETDSIKVVKSVVDGAREELARKAQSPPALEADPPPNRQILDRLAAEPCMGEDGEGFWRILYFL